MASTPVPPPIPADLVLIRAENPGPMTLTGTNTYVVGREPSYVVDPGPDDEAHLDRVRAEGERRGGIAGVVLTHSHADHSAGVTRLGAPLLWGEVSDEDETAALAAALAAAGVERDGFSFQPVQQISGSPDSPRSGEAPGEPAQIGPLRAVATPGHATDHVVLVYGDVCLCGDLILGEGSTIVPPAMFGGSLAAYLDSLERVRALGAELLGPGHGPWITEVEAKIDEYRTHRLERERRLLAALEGGERSRARLLDSVWNDVPEVLRLAAAMAMQAHLEKLEAEGRVVTEELTE